MVKADKEAVHKFQGGSSKHALLEPHMTVETLHAMIGFVFLAIWGMIGHFCVCNGKSLDAEG